MTQELTVGNCKWVISLRETVLKHSGVVNSSIELAERRQCRCSHPDYKVLILITVVLRSVAVQLPDRSLPVRWRNCVILHCSSTNHCKHERRRIVWTGKSRDLRRFEFETAVRFDSKVIGRFSNQIVPAPLLVVSLVKRLKPLTALKRILQLRFDFDSTTTKNEHVHFSVASRNVATNKKAVGWE